MRISTYLQLPKSASFLDRWLWAFQSLRLNPLYSLGPCITWSTHLFQPFHLPMREGCKPLYSLDHLYRYPKTLHHEEHPPVPTFSSSFVRRQQAPPSLWSPPWISQQLRPCSANSACSAMKQVFQQVFQRWSKYFSISAMKQVIYRADGSLRSKRLGLSWANGSFISKRLSRKQKALSAANGPLKSKRLSRTALLWANGSLISKGLSH